MHSNEIQTKHINRRAGWWRGEDFAAMGHKDFAVDYIQVKALRNHLTEIVWQDPTRAVYKLMPSNLNQVKQSCTEK